ncbi:MAG: heavy-metal-associated domain-containing protein [Lentisphaeria bacterium]|nr:heavy-metal-associated domain-containing protein [Candidatus Neomarinimicrobiota bacterium]MCF7842018.1 heavy-metal-associated domain-containing protein [Lentisphaeria bacterium]
MRFNTPVSRLKVLKIGLHLDVNFRTIKTFFFGIILLLVMNCGGEKLATMALKIDEMCCSECQKLVEQTILDQPGVKNLALNYDNQTVAVTLRVKQLAPESLVKVLLDAGLTVDGVADDSTAHAALPENCRDESVRF